MKTRLPRMLAVSVFWALPAIVQFDSGSDGSDGALDCAALVAINPACPVDCDPVTPCSVEIDLGLAAPARSYQIILSEAEQSEFLKVVTSH
ncbi:MAG: hypothetical protein V3U60_09005 [Gammaproteobacteria bacterium]